MILSKYDAKLAISFKIQNSYIRIKINPNIRVRSHLLIFSFIFYTYIRFS